MVVRSTEFGDVNRRGRLRVREKRRSWLASRSWVVVIGPAVWNFWRKAQPIWEAEGVDGEVEVERVGRVVEKRRAWCSRRWMVERRRGGIVRPRMKEDFLLTAHGRIRAC